MIRPCSAIRDASDPAVSPASRFQSVSSWIAARAASAAWPCQPVSVPRTFSAMRCAASPISRLSAFHSSDSCPTRPGSLALCTAA